MKHTSLIQALMPFDVYSYHKIELDGVEYMARVGGRTEQIGDLRHDPVLCKTRRFRVISGGWSTVTDMEDHK